MARTVSRPAVTNPEGESTSAHLERNGLSTWESEGGSTGESHPADVTYLSTAARFWTRGKEAAVQLTSATWRCAQRARLELEVRRLESKVNSEKAALGELLFPLLDAGTLPVDLPEVHDHTRTIRELLAQIRRRRALADIDQNATLRASADQSASDESATASQSPAEQGGQG
jgi:hypothetical protein